MKLEKKLKIKSLFKNLWTIIKPFRKKVVYSLLGVTFLEAFNLLSYYLLKLIIDKISTFNAAEINAILWLIFVAFLVELFKSSSYNILYRVTTYLSIDLEYYLPVLAQKKLLELSLGYHENEETGNKLVKVERGINKILYLIDSFFWNIFPTFIKVLIATIYLMFIDWRFGLLFVAIAPSFVYITYKSNLAVEQKRKLRYKKYEDMSGMMAQSIMNINAVKSFVQEKREHADFRKIKDKIRDIENGEWRSMFNYGFFRELLLIIGRMGMLLLGVYMVYQGAITVGTVVLVYMLAENTLYSMYSLLRAYDRIQEGAEAVNRLLDLIKQESTIKNKPNAITPRDIHGQINFNNVVFRYGKEKKAALNSVNFRINSGCITALVGPSGGGKTTVAKLVYRHYDPGQGAVKIDDIDVRDYNIDAFRKFIAIVPQEVEIFNRSIADNIAYANPMADENEIVAAAKIANAHEFILGFKKGYKTMAGERGVKLSGGQRQRIGIARAILANPRILIFDEATSSLDSQSERLIQDAMDKISQGRTTIIIAHRLSTIKKAHKIIVLEEGEVVEEGSHMQLAQKKGGLYAKLIKLQEMGDVE